MVCPHAQNTLNSCQKISPPVRRPFSFFPFFGLCGWYRLRIVSPFALIRLPSPENSTDIFIKKQSVSLATEQPNCNRYLSLQRSSLCSRFPHGSCYLEPRWEYRTFIFLSLCCCFSLLLVQSGTSQAGQGMVYSLAGCRIFHRFDTSRQ